MTLELKNTKHSYYCSDKNYYASSSENFGRCDYGTWEEFKKEWLVNGSLDDDLNHLFRFDVFESEETQGGFELFLFFILQRKGIFRPVRIHSITKDNLAEIETFLSHRWQYLKSQWREFSGEVIKDDTVRR